MQTFRQLTFYLVAWLCLANFLFLAIDARQNVRANPNQGTVVNPNNNDLVNVNVDANVCLPLVGQFRTYTQVDFGTKGTKAFAYLNTNFLNLFPNGLKLGANIVLLDNGLVGNLVGGLLNTVGGLLDDVLTLLLKDVNSIVTFLPQLAAPSVLTESLTNPDTCPAGLLSGDLVALALNVALDANIDAFSLAKVDLSTLVFIDGTCAGLSVKTVLNLANSVLGDVVAPVLGSSPLCLPADIDVCVATINSNFYDAVKVGAHLALPGLNLQACLNIKLPAISVGAQVSLKLLAPLKRSVGVWLDVQLSGLVDVNADVAVALTNNERYHCWGLDVNVDLKANLAGLLTDLKVVVPASGVGSLLHNVVGTVEYVADDVLCLVNYLLNFAPLKATGKDLQAVIYMLTNPAISSVNMLLQRVPSLVGCNTALVKALLADVKLNGVGFVPAAGQVVGVLAKVNIGGISARVLVEVDVPEIDLSIKTNLCPSVL